MSKHKHADKHANKHDPRRHVAAAEPPPANVTYEHTNDLVSHPGANVAAIISDHRISRQTMFMEIARIVSKRSTCYRLSVGAVAVAHNRVVSIGYNGSPPGHPHCSGNLCPGRNSCKETIHAEANCIIHLPVDMQVDELYSTNSPCWDCCEKIIAEGFKRVYFETPYRITDALVNLRDHGIGVYQMTPSGYVIDWWTKEII